MVMDDGDGDGGFGGDADDGGSGDDSIGGGDGGCDSGSHRCQ